MEPDEIQAAIDRAEAKRREWLDAQPAAKDSAAIFAALPGAAEMYPEQIALGLDQRPREAQKARHTLRKLMPRDVRLVPDGEELWAESRWNPQDC